MRAKALILACLLPAAAAAQPAPYTGPFPVVGPGNVSVRLERLATVPPDDTGSSRARITSTVQDGARTFVNDQNGVTYQLNAGAAPTPYLDIRTQGVGAVDRGGFYGAGQNGLALHPNFNGNPGKPGYGTFYTSYQVPNTAAPTFGNSAGALGIELREWTTAVPGAPTFTGTSRTVLTIGGYEIGPSVSFMAFNPNARTAADPDYGKLYFGVAEGLYLDTNGDARNLQQPFGKIMRIDPLPQGAAPYTVPSDNPYVGKPGALPEVWASGLRNPQSFGWDTGGTGRMFINDLGQATFEEVNVGIAGADYGWSVREGLYATSHAYPGLNPYDEQVYPLLPEAELAGLTSPVAGYSHNDPGGRGSEIIALGSGFLYRGAGIPSLTGKYLLADIVLGRLMYFDPADIAPGALAPVHDMNLSLGGEPFDFYADGTRADLRLSAGPDGEPLVLTKRTGEVFLLADATAVPEPGTLLLLGGLVWAVRRWR